MDFIFFITSFIPQPQVDYAEQILNLMTEGAATLPDIPAPFKYVCLKIDSRQNSLCHQATGFE